jgi:hypothetical protein
MFNTTTTYQVGPKVRLDKIFKNGLPINGFVDKGRCAIGGTYTEIMDKGRCSIIVVCNVSILHNKKASHPELDIVYGNKSYQDVVAYLSLKKTGQKIMTTPEGMRKIMIAAQETGRTKELQDEWFLMLDESHTFITEHFRDDILEPFKYFWSFKKKCIISATPYVFTDETFKSLDYHKIMFTDRLGTVSLVKASSVVGSLNYLLQHLNEFPGNVHIFYNSVTEIRNAILRSGIKDFNIFCANDKDSTNLKKLGELAKFFLIEPEDGIYKKVNFYTSKYFEGWDLNDKNATVVLVTDVHKPHTKVGVSMKGKQAIGRLRDEAHDIIHITNHHCTKGMKKLEVFREEYLYQANYEIAQYNQRVADYTRKGIKIAKDERLEKFAEINEETKLATLELMKLDQQINDAASSEIYNHIDYIEQAWKDAYYNVEKHYSDEKVETGTSIKRKSAAKQLEEDYLKILEYREKQQNGLVFSLGKTPEQAVKDTNSTAYLAAKYLDKAIMEELKYNVKKVTAEIIYKENDLAEVKLLKLLCQTFKIGDKPTNQFIKNKLQEFYNKLNIRDKTGKIRVATASQLGENGRFEIRPDKNKEKENCMLVIRAQFGLRMVA